MRHGCIPDTENDLEALALSSGHDGLSRIAIGGRIATDNVRARSALDGIEIGLVVGLRLAASGGLLRAERKAHVALGGSNNGRAGREGGGGDGGETHGG